MSVTRRVLPSLMAVLTDPRLRTLRRTVEDLRRRVRGAERVVTVFHQVDDPYSHLLAQVLGEFARRYDVTLEPMLCGPPPDDAAPERERLRAYARADAADVAPGYALSFPGDAAEPDPESTALAARMLADLSGAAFTERCVRVGEALWAGSHARLETLAGEISLADGADAQRAIARGSGERARRGHYLGAMLHYGGEWFWGVDRIEHLERRLTHEGARRANADTAPIAARPVPKPAGAPRADARRVSLEYFPSLRSPYTAIVTDRVCALPERYPVDLVFRPVLPMVMRGLPVPRAKQLYIVLDTKREAESAGVAFGRMCDPVGRPVERAFTLYAWARERGREQQLVCEFLRGSFALGEDTGTDEGLRRVLARAGLSWDEARAHLDEDDLTAELEANREELFGLGLWGVPSFRVCGPEGERDYTTWGQDRLWRVEQEILRRSGA